MKNNFKILYIDRKEDSKNILNSLLNFDYDVRLVHTIYDAKTQLLSDDYDLIISETNLEDGNSLEFIKETKEKQNIKTIIVSQSQDPKELLKAIEINIEKYMLKPVKTKELKSSIEELFKNNTKIKSYSNTEELIELDNGFMYDIKSSHIHTNNNDTVVLTPQESSLLKTLIKQKGSYCAHATLISAISVAGKSATIDTLRTVIKKIRKKSYEGIIDSLNGVGYKINIKSSSQKQDISSLISIKKIQKKVLIVKANEKRNNTLQIKLSHYGLECEQVFLLEDAKDAIKHENFDYIIVDLQLPDGDGAEIIRDKNNLKSNKIIILSNSEDMHYKEYLYYKGIVDYIEKRDDIDYLAYSIYQTISKVELNNSYNNILVVESSKKIAEQIKDILLPRNYEVDVINSSDKIFELLKHKSYTLIVIDLELKGVNSLEFLIALKKQVDKALPIIMLSGEKRTYSTVRECYVNGAVECLRKPIFAEEFILKVDQWTEYYKQTLEITDNQRLLSSYKNIIDHTIIISKTDKKGIITYANEMFCNVSQYSKDELIGRSHNVVRHPDMEPSIFKNMWHVISVDKKIWHGILKNKKKDGTHYILSTYIMPILDYNNNVIEYIALRNDITDMKKFQ